MTFWVVGLKASEQATAVRAVTTSRIRFMESSGVLPCAQFLPAKQNGVPQKDTPRAKRHNRSFQSVIQRNRSFTGGRPAASLQLVRHAPAAAWVHRSRAKPAR